MPCCHIDRASVEGFKVGGLVVEALYKNFFPLLLIQEEQVVSYWQKNGH